VEEPPIMFSPAVADSMSAISREMHVVWDLMLQNVFDVVQVELRSHRVRRHRSAGRALRANQLREAPWR
jgi:hypothetical protein